MSDIAIKVEELGKEIQKINLAIVGFQKCATTSIKNYLMEHPEIVGHVQKEMTYFSIEDEYKGGLKEAFKRYYPSISASTKYKLLLAKHATLIRHEESIKRLHEHNSEAKIIVCLRDPVARAFSSYLMEISNGEDFPDFTCLVKEAFESQGQGMPNWHYNVFIRLGQYVDYIEILLKYFSSEQIYYCNIKEFKKDPSKGMVSILNWLELKDTEAIHYEKKHNEIKGVRYKWLASINKMILSERGILKKIANHAIPPNKRSALGERIRMLNKTSIKKPVLPHEAKVILEQHYQPYNEKLLLLTGVDLKNEM